MTADREPSVGQTVRCAECGAENRGSRFFCSSCGAYLRREEDTWEGAAGEDPGAPAPAPGRGSGVSAPGSQSAGEGVPAPPGGRRASRGDDLASEGRRRRQAPDVPPAFERVLGDSAPLTPPPLPSGIGLTAAYSSEESRRRQRALGVGLAFLLLLGLGLTALLVRAALTAPAPDPVAVTTTLAEETTTTTAVPGGPAEDEAPPEDEPLEPPAPTGEVVPLEPDEVEASSELQSEQGNSYAAANVLDEDFETSWQEGAEGDGPGEWLAFSFAEPVRLARIEIANGYQRDDRRFFGNPRLERVRVEYDDGSSQILLLEDEQGYQSFDLEPTETQDLRLVIESVYPGESWEDASLSAIRLFHYSE